jgi:hypothetical protein
MTVVQEGWVLFRLALCHLAILIFGTSTVSINSHIISNFLLTGLPTLPCNALDVNDGSNRNVVCFYTCHRNHCVKVPWASLYPPLTLPYKQWLWKFVLPRRTLTRNVHLPPCYNLAWFFRPPPTHIKLPRNLGVKGSIPVSSLPIPQNLAPAWTAMSCIVCFLPCWWTSPLNTTKY